MQWNVEMGSRIIMTFELPLELKKKKTGLSRHVLFWISPPRERL
jgi:hypothetical protein